MLIMNQDKTMLIPIERLNALYVVGSKAKIDYPIYQKEDYTIGIYDSKQRAKEIIEMIYNRYDRGQRVFPMPEE